LGNLVINGTSIATWKSLPQYIKIPLDSPLMKGEKWIGRRLQETGLDGRWVEMLETYLITK
jgi:hypothetical protein